MELNNFSYYISYIDSIENIPIQYENQDSRWIILSRFDLNQLTDSNDNIILKYPIIRYLLLILVAIALIIIITLSYFKENDKLMLLASGYISEYTHDGVLITDHLRRVIYCNKVFEDTYGYALDEIKGKTPNEFLQGDIPVRISDEEHSITAWEGNIWDLTSSKTYVLKYLKVKTVFSSKNRLVYCIGIYSEPKSKSSIIVNGQDDYMVHSLLDGGELTVLEPLFNESFARAPKNAVIVIKLFDYANLKHSLLDSEEPKFLNSISKELNRLIYEGGVVASPSSELFILALPFEEKSETINEIMKKIDIIFSTIHFLEQPSLKVTYLSGVAISPDHGTNSLELINNAFIALEALTKFKKSKYLIFDHNIVDFVKQDKIIRDEIEHGFERNEFYVVYQVQKRIKDSNSIGVEVLVRWNNPVLGFVSPNQFVPIMEETHHIKRLAKYVLTQTISDFKTIKDSMNEDFKISINLSSEEFTDKRIVSEMIMMIRESGLDPKHFCFEITETMLVDNLDYTNSIINYLHKKSIIVAIYDFSTGFSSLSYLKNLCADKLKVDRMFIKDYPKYDEGIILKAIVSMAKELGISLIVEGVETKEQLDFVTELGCEEYQGYYASKPVPFEEFKKQL